MTGVDLFGATHEGAQLASRSDGDARFVAGTFYLEWTRTLKGPLSLRLAANGQIASRPLLSSQEIGIGGPAFGRAYDYSERTGDNGLMGSAELRFDLTKLPLHLRRTQLYTFVDGGGVSNLRGGNGGGRVASAGGGLRIGLGGAFDASIEAAYPLNTDRFGSGNRSPRVSFSIVTRI